MLEGLRGEDNIAALCRREDIAESFYYNWSNDFLEAGKKRLADDPARSASISCHCCARYWTPSDKKWVSSSSAPESRITGLPDFTPRRPGLGEAGNFTTMCNHQPRGAS